MQISARNKLSGTVAGIDHGAVTTTVKIRLGGGDTVTASITREAAEELALAEGTAVTAVIKASDVLVATDA
ncbi:MAG TPA: TOBE domain-containing protein [Acidimicrobiales bacterium]|nr:TOBE domain-containing protein [Acidimicrobiales bacterium]